jgi:hypothetical protein
MNIRIRRQEKCEPMEATANSLRCAHGLRPQPRSLALMGPGSDGDYERLLAPQRQLPAIPL